MAQLRQDFEKITALDTVIIIVGPESAGAFKIYWKENNLPFIGLPDPKHIVLKKLGQEVNLFKLGRMPAQVIVDKSGIVRFAHYGHQMADIPDNNEIIDLLKEINHNE